jgi:predicted nucleic acid-binding protein
LVVDTNILLSTALGLRTRATWEVAGTTRRLLISYEGAAEALSVAAHLQDRAPHVLDDMAALLRVIDVLLTERYVEKLREAEATLCNAVASRNGSIRDAHILALAWTYDADIWSHDRDFAGTGWPSWSSANLAEALSEEAAASAAKTS